MKTYRWSPDKNDLLKRDRGVSFEQVVIAIESGGLLDIVPHPDQEKFPKQKVLVVGFDGYAFLVPFVDAEDHYFLKTVIPSRKATRDYSQRGVPDDKDR